MGMPPQGNAAPAYDLFLSHGAAELSFACDLEQRLEQRGHRVFTEGRDLRPGDDRAQLIAQALDRARVTVVLLASGAADYYGREEIARAVNRAEREAGTPGAHRVVPVFLSGRPIDVAQVPYGLVSKQPIDAVAVGGIAGVAQALADLLDQLGRSEPPPPTLPFAFNPFRLLRPFTEDDVALFHGRELITRRLADLIHRQRLVLLHGSSGTGKSSLVQAGLLPLIRHDMHALVVQPGLDVHAAIRTSVQAAAQALGVPTDPGNAASSIAYGLTALASAADKTRGTQGTPLRGVLLVIDQAEELFVGRSPAEQQAVAARLATELQAALHSGGCPIHVLLSLRSDYHGHLDKLRDAGLLDIYNNSLLLDPLDRSATQAAIERPLASVGLRIESGLLDQVLRDLSSQTGDVNPVELELVCHEFYEAARSAKQIELHADLYNQMGGAGKVLATYVGGVLRGFLAQRPLVLRLLAQLVSPDGSRQPAKDLTELSREAEIAPSLLQSLLEDLVKQRVVTTVKAQPSQEPRYRIGHDLLAVEIWNQLSVGERRDRELSERLRQLTAEWASTGRSYWLGYVSPGTRSDLLDWHLRHRASSGATQQAFLRSLAHFHSAARAARYVIPMLVIALLVGSATLVYSYHRSAREHEAQTAEAKAEGMLERDPGRALAWLQRAAELRGGIEYEAEKDFHAQWLFAREAWEQGLGWVATQHPQQVQKVAFSPPSRYGETCPDCWPTRKLLASAASDGTVRLVDLSEGGTGLPLPSGHTSAASDLAFSPDGRWLASCGFDGTVRLWDVRSRSLFKVLRAVDPRTEFALLTFSPDGQWLAAASANGGAILGWQPRQLDAPPQQWAGHSSQCAALKFSPNSRWLASGDMGGSLIVTDTGSGTFRRVSFEEIIGQKLLVQNLAWSPRGDRLLVSGAGAGGKNVVLVHRDLTEPLSPPLPAGGTVGGIAFSPDGALIGIGNQQGQVYLWDPYSNETLLLAHHRRLVWHTEFSRNGTWLLSSGEQGLLELSHRQGTWQRQLRGHDRVVNTAVFSPDSRLVASAGQDGSVRVWPLQPGRTELRATDSVVRILAASDPHRTLAAGTDSGKVWFWSSPHPGSTGSAHLPTRPHGICFRNKDQVLVAAEDGVVRAFHFPDGALINEAKSSEPLYTMHCPPSGPFLTGHEHAIFHWSSPDGSPRELGEHDDKVSGLALLPDHRVVSASMDKTLRVWDERSGTLLRKKAVERAVLSLSLLSGHEVVFAGETGSVQLWDLGSDELRSVGPIHGGIIYDVAASPKRALVATASGDGLRLIWPGSQVFRLLPGHIGAVTSVTFATDAEYLISGGQDSIVRLWPLPPTDRLEFARWLKQVTPWELRGDRLVPKPLPPWNDALVGPPAPPLRYDSACIDRSCKDLTQYQEAMTLDSCVSACLIVD